VHEENQWYYRQYHSEGFVNIYILENISDTGAMTFVTKKVENGPPGSKARLRIEKIDENSFVEYFDLAFTKEGEFEVCIRNKWKRIVR
jgi:hypothetical protein